MRLVGVRGVFNVRDQFLPKVDQHNGSAGSRGHGEHGTDPGSDAANLVLGSWSHPKKTENNPSRG